MADPEAVADDAIAARRARWREVSDLFDLVLDLPPAERSAALATRCAGDATLRAEVEALLDAAAGSAGFMAVPARELIDSTPPPVDRTGVRIGPFRLVREIGRGGMGTVHLAERADEQFAQRVALKLLIDEVGSPHLVRRFLAERQILASLAHPHIARLLDGGVTERGAPWFAMEHIEGTPIDRFCARHRPGVRQRLDLFLQVCDAAGYAHRNLIVHRDLKPGNILVDDSGAVKLLDFGIARLLDASSSSGTTRVVRMMTPEYASPQQLRGDPPSTSDDVYALGVLLCVMLTGRVPVDADAVADRDLGAIVARATSADPAERFGSVDELAADVQRWLDGRPVYARRASRLYAVRKFLQRNRWSAAAAAALFAILGMFSAVTTVQARRIAAQSARIAVENDKARQVTAFLVELLENADPYRPGGAAPSVRDVLDRGSARVEQDLTGQPEVRAELLYAMARAYFGIGELERARDKLMTAAALYRFSAAESVDLASALNYLATIQLNLRQPAAAETLYIEALRQRTRLLGEWDRSVIRTLSGLGAAYQGQGRHVEAEATLLRALALERSFQPVDRLGEAQLLRNLAHSLRDRRDFVAAESLYRQTLTLHREQFGDRHPETGNSMVNLGVALRGLGRHDEAETMFRAGLDAKRDALGDENWDVLEDGVAFADLLLDRGRLDEARSLYVAALAVHRRTLSPTDGRIGNNLFGLARVRRAAGDTSGALPLLREARDIYRAAYPAGHPRIGEVEALLNGPPLP